MEYTTIRTDVIPKIVWEAEPQQPVVVERIIDHERAVIETDHILFDGPMVMATMATAELITAYPTTYAQCSTHEHLQLGGVSSLGLGPVASILMFYDEAGQGLWAQRSGSVTFPYYWGPSANGGIQYGETLLDGLEREMSEELGITFDNVEDLEMKAMLIGDMYGVSCIFRAQLCENTLLIPGHEVIDTRWKQTPQQLGLITPMTMGIWEASQPT